MAIPTNNFTTYDSIGNREDLINIITNISPVDTWFTSKIGNTKATSRFHEWQTDSLASPAANAHIEGDTITATAITPTTRTGCYTQILQKSFMVTNTQDVVDKAGRDTDTAYQLQKNMKELAMDIEYALLLNPSCVSGDTATARQLKGVLGYIATNVYTGTASGNTNPVTKTNITSVLQSMYTSGAKPQYMLCGGVQKSKISDMTTSNTKFVNAPEKTVVDSVDVYDTDFGRLAIHLSHILDGTSNATKGMVMIFGDMNLWQKAWLRPIEKRSLPIASFSNFYAIEAELTLEARQEAGSGILKNLTVT